MATAGVDHFILAPLGFGPGDLQELMQVMATTSPLCCSGCGARMKRLPIKGISVDLCAACGSGWLDAGERVRLADRR
jgi:predicted nucleic acid-binding Zn ribbon protein